MPACPLPPSFLDTYSPSMSSHGCKASCMIICFLVLGCICWSSSIVYFKNGPEYLKRGQPRCLFQVYSFLLSSFLIPLRYSFLIFSFIAIFLMESASNIPMYLQLSFSPRILIFSWFGSSIPSVMSCFTLLIVSMLHFSILNFIPVSWLYIFTTYLQLILSL